MIEGIAAAVIAGLILAFVLLLARAYGLELAHALRDAYLDLLLFGVDGPEAEFRREVIQRHIDDEVEGESRAVVPVRMVGAILKGLRDDLSWRAEVLAQRAILGAPNLIGTAVATHHVIVTTNYDRLIRQALLRTDVAITGAVEIEGLIARERRSLNVPPLSKKRRKKRRPSRGGDR